MASTSIQGRVDSEVWNDIKQTEETNTQVLQRLAAHYVATSGDELLEIAPTFDAAVAVLLNSHSLLNQLMQNAVITVPNGMNAPSSVSSPIPESIDRSAIDCADNW